jgi:general secretion pathway protein L
MSLLLVALPSGAPGAYPYAVSRDGEAVADHGVAAPTLLPPAGRGVEVVAIVSARQLSWQHVALPKGVGPGSSRLTAVLAGLLEEQLLDDPEQLHFALAPDVRPGQATRVAVCNQAWLTAHLKALEAAGRPAARIVPEAEPRAGGALRALAIGEPGSAELILTGGTLAGVQVLPLPDDAHAAPLLALVHSAFGANTGALELLAEPPAAQQAEHLFQRPAQLVTPAERWLTASRSRWDLAQMALAQSGRARTARRLTAWWREVLHAPLWRPARWGLALLLLINLIGLNARAWNEKNDLATRSKQIAAVLTTTFPQVKVVVDAPVQMAREVRQLRQSTGSASPRDLEPMLAAWASVSEAAKPTAIEYSSGQLRLADVKLTADQVTQANERLRPQGYQLKTENGTAVLRALDEVF